MRLLALLAALLLAGPASADLWSHGCVVTNDQCIGAGDPYDCCTGAGTGNCPSSDAITGVNNLGTGSQSKRTIRALERACWWVENADTGARDSLTWTATSQVKVCVNDDILTDSSGGAIAFQPIVRRCPDGGRPATNPNDVCNEAVAMTEAVGPPSTTCTNFDPGLYFFDLGGVACVAGDACQLSIEGVDPQRQ